MFRQAWNIRFAPDLSPEANERFKGIKLWEKTLNRGVPARLALEVVVDAFGRRPSYWYRWRKRMLDAGSLSALECESRAARAARKRAWDPGVVRRVKTLRNHPDSCRWGARKIRRQLLKEGKNPPSVSTLERIIARLKATKEIRQPDTDSRYRKRNKHVRIHAEGYRKSVHGTLSRVQMDVDHCWLFGKKFHAFSAIHADSRYLWSRAYSSASARCGRDFLMRVLAAIPEGLSFDAVRIDEGSEFRKEFEEYCKDMRIPLLVNRPRTPQQNAFVERARWTIDHEFRQTRLLPDTVAGINEELAEWVEHYNWFRPHASLGYMTPCEKLAGSVRMEAC